MRCSEPRPAPMRSSYVATTFNLILDLVRPMRRALTLILLPLAIAAQAAEDLSKYGVWITGEPIFQNGQLMFRADKPVRGNATGNLVLLGATRQTINVLAPSYMKAAEKRMRLRLYGLLVPIPDSQRSDKGPSVEFVTWKMHLPSDPDELPAKDRIIIGPDSKVPGYTVEKKP